MVFGEGSPDAQLLYIGEGPGMDEDLSGRPFVGRSGKLLRNLSEAIGLNLIDQVYIANVCKCRPPNNRPPEPEEIEQCSKFLKKQIEFIGPKLIALLGRTAVKAILPDHAKTPIEVLRGKVGTLSYEGTPVMVTYHPSALLRDPSRKVLVREDFLWIKNFIGSLNVTINVSSDSIFLNGSRDI
jgi:DNA polymerase